jgi:hypothetical protein
VHATSRTFTASAASGGGDVSGAAAFSAADATCFVSGAALPAASSRADSSTRRTSSRVDTRSWLGAAYAPAAAPGDLWLSPALFSRYLPAVDRELAAAARHLATSTVRVFLHTLAYEAGPAAFLDNVDTFLAVAEGRGIRAGLVLFDACWNTAGGNATSAGECVPVKGRHNGCWYESPQAADMTTLERYKPYVDGVVSRFGDDSRVAWIEVYNEPRAPNADFVFALRDAGYEWATALQPSAPLISCWDDNNNTEIVDHHDYGANFASEWAPAVYVNPRKGAVITEADGEKQAAIARAEGAKQAAILEAEGRREAAFRDSEARERSAEAEAEATRLVSEAIAKGDLNAINYFIAQRYVDAFAKLAESPQQRTVIVPAEMSSMIGSIAGIAELLGGTRNEAKGA